MIAKPNLPDSLPQMPWDDSIRILLEDAQEWEEAHFCEGELCGLTTHRVEFSACRFTRCTLRDCDVKRFCFVDCVLDHCDLSNLRFENSTFQRVRFMDCRLTGAEWMKAVLMNVSFENCSMDYANLVETKLDHVEWKNCRMRESSWASLRAKQTFSMCDLTSAMIRGVPMKGMDMTTCSLDGISIDPADLRGMRVTPMQALMFSRMLGLEIVD